MKLLPPSGGRSFLEEPKPFCVQGSSFRNLSQNCDSFVLSSLPNKNRLNNMLGQRGGLAPPATYIQSVDWSFRVGGVGGVGSVSSVLLLAYIDFDVDLWTR